MNGCEPAPNGHGTEPASDSAGTAPTLSDVLAVAMDLVQAIQRLAESNEAMVDSMVNEDGEDGEGGSDDDPPRMYLDGTSIR